MTDFGQPNETYGTLVPPGFLDAMYRSMLGLGPETRSPEQIAADRATFKAESDSIAAKIKADHAAAVAAASTELRPFLELHAPVFWSHGGRTPECQGCDFGGYESEAPEFPCRTYELALGGSA